MSSDQYLYRILSFKHVVDIFRSKQIHFASPQSWDDPYERLLKHQATDQLYAQCWSTRSVSDAMWRIYSPDRMSVRIRTSRSKLRHALREARVASGIGWKVSDVMYFRKTELDGRLSLIRSKLEESFSVKAAAESLFFKRDAFQHETEVRAILFDQHGSAALDHRRVAVEPQSFIENLYFDPRVDAVYEEMCSHFLKTKLRYRGKVGRSSLYKEPGQIVVGGR